MKKPPPPTRYGPRPTIQPKDGQSAHPVRMHSPPATQFGTLPSVQMKPQAGQGGRGAPAPPPTKFGPKAVQPKSKSSGRNWMEAPAMRPSISVQPVNTWAVVQKMDKITNLFTTKKKAIDRTSLPYIEQFHARYPGVSGQLDDGDFMDIYSSFVAREHSPIVQYSDEFTEDVGKGIAKLLGIFIEGARARGITYDTDNNNCTNFRNNFKRALAKIQINAADYNNSTRAIYFCPNPIDPTFTGCAVFDREGKLLPEMKAFDNHQALKIMGGLGDSKDYIGMIADPTGGYLGPEHDWYVKMNQIKSITFEKKSGSIFKKNSVITATLYRIEPSTSWLDTRYVAAVSFPYKSRMNTYLLESASEEVANSLLESLP